MLYGVTSSGGATEYGVVFSINRTTRAEKVLYSLTGGNISSPLAGVIDVKGILYGTTFGDASNGAVFAVDPATGTETTVYSFCSQLSCTDGQHHGAELINIKGTLYGTTDDGCAYGGGTVFSVDPATGNETVVHSFGSDNDGEHPRASLTYVNGTLYGTTWWGGAYDSRGTVFPIVLADGTETVLHSFGNGTDGSTPLAGVINIKGVLYGATSAGGVHGDGTVYSIDLNGGGEAVLYSFCGLQNCADGDNPQSGFIDVQDKLYGTTISGGTKDYGTAFSIDPATGNETVLYSFQGNTDGGYPSAGLINKQGKFYGTTAVGGTYGFGTVFEIKP
jgi:uncharacterized repeat protein (TIGR03803 family)